MGFLKKVAKVALPIAGAALGGPLGIGAVAGGALGGAAGGAIGGGGLKDIAIGGATGGLGGAFGSGALGSTLGNASRTALQGAVLGAGAGAQNGGGLGGALTGGLLGGAGGYALGGGSIPGLSGSGSSVLGAKAGTSLGQLTGNAALQGPTQGAGLLGATSGGGLSALTGGGNVGLGSLLRGGNLLNTAGNLYSGYATDRANEDIQRQLLAAQGRVQDVIQPFADTGLQAQQQLSQRLTEGFQPGDLTQDPGYQFRLYEGQKALERSLAAQGLGQSGQALKAAQEYGQGLAGQTYDDAYRRYLALNQQIGGLASQGQQAAGTLGNVLAGQGQIGAYGTAAQQDNRNRTLAALLSGSGYSGVY